MWKWIMLTGLFFSIGFTQEQTNSLDFKFDTGLHRYNTGKTLAIVGAFSPVMLFVSGNGWVAFSMFLGWQTMNEVGLGLMNSGVQDMRGSAIGKLGPDVDSYDYRPSKAYLIGNACDIAGVGLITVGIIRESTVTEGKQDANFVGLGVLTFIVGEVIHAYSYYKMREDAQYYETQYKAPPKKSTEEDEISWHLQPILYPASTGVATGMYLTAVF